MRCVFGFLVALAVLGFVACGGDECAEPVGDVTGVWRMNSTVVDDDCGERENQTFRMAIAQDGNGLTAVTPELEFNGTICGDQIRMSGSFSEGGGTVTVNATLDISADGQSMQGSDTWTWTDGFESCSGSDSLSGTRVEPADVFPCTEQGIRDAITIGGGPHTFACAGPTTVITEAEIVIDYDVILDGEGNLMIDGNGDHRVFSVAEGIEAELHGFSVTRGWSSSGAGGGILNMGTLSVTNSTISGNDGSGINNWFEATLTLANSTVSENSGVAGGIENAGTLTVTNSTISGNTAAGGAGGIWSNGPLTITDSTLSGNRARPGTGGLFLAAHTEATVTNSTISGNSTQRTAPFNNGNGGGIENDGTLTLTNSTVSGNTADDRGGGIYNVWTLTLANSTLSGNTASEGNGIHNEFGTLTVTNTAVDGDCYIDGGVATSRGYNIESPADTCGFDQSTDMPAMSADDLKLGELADNGGPTMTHALEVGSEAINKIPADACELEEDQRGEPRPDTGGTMCDVGAFERQPAALDLLILIDDSTSMRDEQDKFAEQVPRLVNLLLTGGAAEPTAVGEFPEVESLHVGIITPDLGWSTEPMTSYSPPGDFNPTAACEENNGNGKAGSMQVEGSRGEPRVPCQAQTPPEGTLYLDYPEPGFTAADLISDVECLTGQNHGCGFEQQLEAILASDRNTANGGFSREGALLTIILITDEDDCSTTDPRVFDVEPRPGNPYQGPFTSMNEVQFNLRCWAHSQALQQIQRYVDSIADLKGDPSQVVFAAITGIPEDSALDRENFNSDEERYDAILAADTMQEVPDPSTDDTQGQQLTPACTATDGSGSAAPGRRIVETMRGLAADNTGVGTVVESICAADYAPALDAIVDRIAAALRRQ